EVVLFSGGLDSLGGAVREAVEERRRVLLVNHRSTTKPGPRQQGLVAGLRPFCAHAPRLVPVRANKDSRLTRENTQRS
ncbi:hypothetical protein, partial [Enterococcus casseliflavus]|uniref:hypothetical protein n=1 Tax=Enterococcus casseliflavus TaxID=37734 RepID=UPI003D0A3AA4